MTAKTTRQRQRPRQQQQKQQQQQQKQQQKETLLREPKAKLGKLPFKDQKNIEGFSRSAGQTFPPKKNYESRRKMTDPVMVSVNGPIY